MFRMTSQGHPYTRFRRALERRSVILAWTAAAELEHVTLEDALALCLLVRDEDQPRYPRAAVRWLARFCDEAPAVTLDEVLLVVAHLGALRGRSAAFAGRSLGELFAAAGRRELADVVRRWESEPVQKGHLAQPRIRS